LWIIDNEFGDTLVLNEGELTRSEGQANERGITIIFELSIVNGSIFTIVLADWDTFAELEFERNCDAGSLKDRFSKIHVVIT
jgi:hypothetical protein